MKQITVTMIYRLSEAGRKSALLMSRPAMDRVVEPITVDATPELVDLITVTSEGKAELRRDDHMCSPVYLNTPPDGPIELHAMYTTAVEARKREVEERLAAMNAKREQEAAEREKRIQRDKPEVDALLKRMKEAVEPVAGVEMWPFTVRVSGKELMLSVKDKVAVLAEQKRIEDIQTARKMVVEQEKVEKMRAKRAAMMAERGGCVFPVKGSMCTFHGAGVWVYGKHDKRWVGVFTQSRGIDRFLESPRGEQAWDVTPLTVGLCVQGGGYDMDRKGRRSREVQWFGVVKEITDTDIVISVRSSRSDALRGL